MSRPTPPTSPPRLPADVVENVGGSMTSIPEVDSGCNTGWNFPEIIEERSREEQSLNKVSRQSHLKKCYLLVLL